MRTDSDFFIVTMAMDMPGQATLAKPQLDDQADRELRPMFDQRGPLADAWREILYTTDELVPTDWLMPYKPIVMVSEKVRTILSVQAGPRDVLEFLPVTLRLGDGREVGHYLLHWPEQPDVYNVERTEWGATGIPRRYCLSREKLQGRRIAGSGVLGDRVVVSGPVLTALEESDALRGATWDPAPLD